MSTINGITTVLFDLDGTLRHTVPHGHEVFWAFAASLGAPNTPEDHRQAQQWAHTYWAESKELHEDLAAYKKDSEKEESFWVNYAHRHLIALGASQSQAAEWGPQVHQHMRDEHNPEDIVPDDVHPTLQALKDAGLTLGVVTNRSRSIDDYVDQIGLAPLLDFYFAAGDIGHWKPNPEIFHYALEKAQAEAHQTVFVGDNYYTDIVGAENVNIQPILIDPKRVFPDAACPVIDTLSELKEHVLAKAG